MVQEQSEVPYKDTKDEAYLVHVNEALFFLTFSSSYRHLLETLALPFLVSNSSSLFFSLGLIEINEVSIFISCPVGPVLEI